MGKPIVELHRVTVYREKTKALEDITVTVRAGEHVAVLGPNGAGKSTLLKLITRELYPVARPESTVRLFGRKRWDVWALRRRLGIVSHEVQRQYRDHVVGLDVVLSGFYWSTGTWPHQAFTPAQQERARQLMARFGVGALSTVPFSHMSAGEQRRCLLARALVHNPDVLILDEPTNGLDVAARFAFLELVRGVMAEGKTVLLVTHRLEEVMPEIERVVLLKGGRLLAEGPKDHLLTDRWLSRLYGVPLAVVQANGHYRVVPAGGAR
ncbi:MAG: ATP-binding cassette domain-containing protein [Ardenticatenia bacterium]|nr:ATP-binding cassette domain-containing protein [Ardenticatenia bacterium]